MSTIPTMKPTDFSVLTLAIIVSIVCLQCPDPAESCSFEFDDRCFVVHTEKTTRPAAAERCTEAGGGELAAIENLQASKLIRKKLIGTEKETNYWIGLVDHEGALTWNYNRSGHYPEWNGRPHDFPCFLWNGQQIVNSDCNVLAGYICESASSRNSSKSDLCPKGSYPSTDGASCFWRTSRSVPMFAKPGEMGVFEECALSGGVPLNVHEIHGKSIGSLVGSSLFIDSETDYWVDMYYDGAGLANSSRHLLRQALVYKDTRKSSKLCFVMHVDKVGKRHLGSRSCLNFTYGICQANKHDVKSPIVSRSISKRYLECPHGYNWKEDTATGYCYWETSYETSRLTWASARSYCQSYGGDLASFHSKNEEVIGLSFQYGTLIHPYWIGLKYDSESESYKWVDGSPVQYSNWASDQPKNYDGRMACVQMQAAEKHWVASYCGALSWFVCKAPKQVNPKFPVLPTQQPLQKCSTDSTGYKFEDYCYTVPQNALSWEEALVHCENKGENLVSIHSENETDFLIKMLYDLRTESRNVWIGANAGLDIGGPVYKWVDGTAMDFLNWEADQGPMTDYSTLICANMYVMNGLWRKETACYQTRYFICKRSDTLNTLVVDEDFATASVPPAEGHCKKEWLQFENSCFLVKGMMKNKWKNWEEASDACRNESANLVSINDEKEQEIVAFLLQYVKNDVHIGLHMNKDHLYVWNNDTDVKYSHWNFVQGNSDDLTKKCVKMVYDADSMGAWRTSSCSEKLPYICKASIDPEIISTPELPKFMRCLHPRDWTKIGTSCFKLFQTELSRPDAEASCRSQYSSSLVSISDATVLALVKYLAIDTYRNFWIGLSLNADREFQWSNNYTMEFSNWDKNQPNLTTQCCSSSPMGHWKFSSCAEEKRFICQVTGEPASNFTTKKEKNQNCPRDFIDAGGKYCYYLEKSIKRDWSDANVYCLSMGGDLASFHTSYEMTQLQNVHENNSYFIGMMKNINGGFSWIDQSPVDFVNWVAPDNNNHRCVIMTGRKLEWKVVSCDSKHHFTCGKLKVLMKMNSATDSALVKKELQAGLSGGAIAAVIIILLVSLSVVAGLLYYIRSGRRLHFGMFSKNIEGVTSFENALFDPDAGVALSQKKYDDDVDE